MQFGPGLWFVQTDARSRITLPGCHARETFRLTEQPDESILLEPVDNDLERWVPADEAQPGDWIGSVNGSVLVVSEVTDAGIGPEGRPMVRHHYTSGGSNAWLATRPCRVRRARTDGNLVAPTNADTDTGSRD